MEEKYIFGEIKWAYSIKDTNFIIPFVIYDNEVKDILNNRLYNCKSFFNYIESKNCKISSGVKMVIDFGLKRMGTYRGFRIEEDYGKFKSVSKAELNNIKNIFLLGIKEKFNKSNEK